MDRTLRYWLTRVSIRLRSIVPVAEGSNEGYYCVGGPTHDEQEEDGEGDLGDLDLSRVLVGVRVARQALHVHFLGLSSQHGAVLAHLAEQLRVADHDERHGDGVGPGEDDRHEEARLVRVTQEVKRAGGEETLWNHIKTL